MTKQTPGLLSLIIGGFFIFTTIFTPALAQTVDWKSGTLGHLSQHIGTHNYDIVLRDSAVASAIETMLGPQAATLTDSMVTRTPIGFSGTCLVLQGNASRRGGDKMAYVAICPVDGKVEIALASDGVVDVYTPTKTYSHIDHGLRQWIGHYLTINTMMGERPPNVTLLQR